MLNFVPNLSKNRDLENNALFWSLMDMCLDWMCLQSHMLSKNIFFHSFFVSHTSMWSQPNGNGQNLQINTCIEKAIVRLWLRYECARASSLCFDIIICHTRKEFIAQERQELFTCILVMTFSAYRY